MMEFGQLLEAAGVEVLARRGDGRIRKVVADSRQVQPGTCFVAVRGPDADGHDYIGQAVAAGAEAIVCEDPAAVGSATAFARVADTAVAAGLLAQAALGWPARGLQVLGATGTKGKTTFAYLVRHILQSSGHKVGMIGTISYEFADQSIPAYNTTPGAVELADLTAKMVAAGVTHLVMEVSSHALDQRRTAGLEFAAAAFTNLSGDHLDYHRTMENYLAAKRQLFDDLRPDATAVLNLDDEASAEIDFATDAKVLWYGLSPAADLRARIEKIDSAGTRFDLIHEDKTVHVASGLIGRHNVMNCLAAAGVCLSQGMSLAAIAEALNRPVTVPGRFQRVDAGGPFQVLVDYAHTDDALANALSALQPLTEGRLIAVFGCGGDRDHTKRPRMACVAQRWADRVIVTSDNPRTEDPDAIIDEIVAGFDAEGRAKLHVEPDRRAAIAEAIGQAQPGDVVVLAGKGHEDYQLIGCTKHHFDDAEVAAEALAGLRQTRPAGGGQR